MRLFVSVDVSEEVKEHVRELQEQIPRGTGNFSMTKPGQCHITLTFLGDVDEKQVEMVQSRIESVEVNPMRLKTDKLGFFPSDSYIRVFWLGLEENEELQRLAEDVRSALPMFEDDHEFHAHVTIARVKSLPGKAAFKKAVEEMEVKEVEFEVDSFKLMKSELKPEGPVYEVVEEYEA